jgi:hypothetical protein
MNDYDVRAWPWLVYGGLAVAIVAYALAGVLT